MWKQIAVYGTSTALNRAVVFLSTLLLATTYSPAQIGEVVLAYTVAQLAVPLASLGGIQLVLREGVDDAVRGKWVARVFGLAVLGSLSTCLLLTWLLGGFPMSWIGSGVALGCIDAFHLLSVAYFQSRGKVWHAFLLSIVKTWMFLAAIGIGATRRYPVEELLQLQIIMTGVVALAAFAWIVKGRLPPYLAGQRAPVAHWLALGFAGIPHSFALWASTNMDRLALGLITSKAALGSYTIAYTVAQCTLLLQSGYAAVFSVEVSKDEERWVVGRDLSHLLLRAGAASLGLFLLSASCALLEMVAWGKVNWPQENLFLMAGTIAAGMTLAIWYVSFAGFLLRRRMTGAISQTTAKAAGCSIPVALLLVFGFGEWGAAATVVLGYAMLGTFFFERAAMEVPQLRMQARRLAAIATILLLVHFVVGGLLDLLRSQVI